MERGTELIGLPVHRLRQLLDRRELTAKELVEACLARIEAVDGQVGAFLTVTADRARQAAEEADRFLARSGTGAGAGHAAAPSGAAAAGERGEGGGAPLLAGIPWAAKDNLCTAGVRTTCASRMLDSFVPPYDATVVARLAALQTPLVGKTNLDEFAMGSSTENSALQQTRNPWDLSRVPGGSSGGSAAAVAAGEVPFALGSDTGGSIRLPAAFCGVVGLKPTYGAVSRYGLVAFASSLDQIGPITRSVRDAALVFAAIAGHDPNDSTSIPQAPPEPHALLQQIEKGVRGLRLGLVQEYFGKGLDPEVEARIREAVGGLEAAGAEVEEVSLPHAEHALAAYYLIAPAEASSNLARYDGVRYGLRVEAGDVGSMFRATRRQGFGAEVKRRVMLGTYALSSGYYDAYYLKALKVRTLISRDFERVFAKVDVLVTPTAPTPAFPLGAKAGDPLAMYLTDVYTIPVNLAGLPAVSVPAGFTAAGLPVGLQVIGPALSEARILQVARAVEQQTGLEGRIAGVRKGRTSDGQGR